MPICATTRTWLSPKRRPKRRAFPCDSLARVSLSAGVMSTLVAWRAGMRPKKIPLTNAMSSVNESTRQSRPTFTVKLSFPLVSRSNSNRMQRAATPMPARPLRSASTTLSVSS